MEISLTHILLAAIGMGALVIIVQAVIFNKLKKMQGNSAQLLSDTNSQLSKAIDTIPAMIQAHFQTGVEQITDAQQAYQNKSQQSFKAINQLFTAKIEDKHVENRKLHSQLQAQLQQLSILSTKQHEQTASEIVAVVASVQDMQQASNQLITCKIEDTHTENSKQHTQLQTLLQQLQQQQSTLSTEQHKHTASEIVAALASSQGMLKTGINDMGSMLSSAIKRAQTELEKDAKKLTFINKQHQLSNLETLSSLIQNLRVQNLVELTNELAQHTELTVDTLDFVKHLGECKVVKIEDKHTGQVTQVYYENGIKHSSDTLLGEQLKYQMFYDQEGRLAKGVEYNVDQQVSFEYIYDVAGEINQRLEYVYDANGKQADPIKKVY